MYIYIYINMYIYIYIYRQKHVHLNMAYRLRWWLVTGIIVNIADFHFVTMFSGNLALRL